MIFKPNGQLNIATAATDLPDDGLTICRNLRVDQRGVVKTRDGSQKINASAIDTPIYFIIVQNGNRYSFAGDNIYLNESSIASGLTQAQWSAVSYRAFNELSENVYALNGADRKRINGSDVIEWGIEAPVSKPGFGTAIGSLTGTYSVKITYARKEGSTVVSESNPSPASSEITLSSQGAQVSWLTPSDPQITHIRVYRTLANGGVYFFDQDVEVGITTTDTTQPDGSLGAQVETDHDRPPAGSFVFGPSYDGTCFIIKDNRLYFCKPKQPEYWPTSNFIEVGSAGFPGKTLVFFNGQLHWLSTSRIYYIQGTGATTFFPIPAKSKTGSQSFFGAVEVAGTGIFHIGDDGIYLYTGDDAKFSEAILEPIFRGETVNGIPGVCNIKSSWLHFFENALYFGYCSALDKEPNNILVFNMDSWRLSHHIYNDGSDIQVRTVTTDKSNNRFLVGDSAGFIREIENKSLTTDSGGAISWELQSKDFTLQTRKHFPRWVKYDVDASSALSVSGRLYLDGALHQTHTLSGNRNTRRRLVEPDNGDRVAINLSGSGEVEVYAAEFE